MVADHAHDPNRRMRHACADARGSQTFPPTAGCLAEGAGTASEMAHLVPPAFPVAALVPDARAADVVTGVRRLLGRGPRTGPATANRERSRAARRPPRGLVSAPALYLDALGVSWMSALRLLSARSGVSMPHTAKTACKPVVH